MNSKILIVPGYAGSGPAHWQSWLQNRLPDSERVTGIDWHDPILPRWSERIGRTLEAAPAPVWIIAHSFGSLASAAAIAHQPGKIAGALLVAPADPERFSLRGIRDRAGPKALPSIADLLPRESLAINGLLVASENDPWLSLDGARQLAQRWRLPLLNAGRVGHINTESGFGPWPFLLSLLAALRFETEGRSPRKPPRKVGSVSRSGQGVTAVGQRLEYL